VGGNSQQVPVVGDAILFANILSKNFCDQLRCYADSLFTRNIAIMLLNRCSKFTSNVISIVSRDLHF